MRHTNHAFTLIEVLAAIVLIAAALIPIMIISSQMIENSIKGERLAKIIFLAENKMEKVKSSIVNNFAASRDESVTAFDSPYENYKYIVSDNEGSNIKVVQVQTWYDENTNNTLDFDEQSITLDTKVADRR